MDKKGKLMVTFSILFLIIVLVVVVYSKYREEPKVILNDNLKVSLNEKVNILSFVDKIEKGEICSKNDIIDTSSLGKKQIIIELKNRFSRKTNYIFEIEVIDTEKPTIFYTTILQTTVGIKIDLLKDVKVTDNWDKDLKVTVEGEYNFDKVGDYKLYYKSVDSSGNEAKEEFVLKVIKKDVSISSKIFTTSNGFTGTIKNGVTYIDDILIANKTYSLPSNYGKGLTIETTNAFNKMKEAAKKENLSIKIVSGFRSYSLQKTLYNNYVAIDGKKEADTYSARPGHSEHQTGLAFDINKASDAFDNTKEAKWLYDNCYKYGFILRYPKGKEDKTGYMYESWHFRYVGTKLATTLYNAGDWITLEEYFGITSKY